ncbi:glycine zipper 2TM domain-containing protein [Phenylobacterium sp.]|jgi:hypothetical protein|uniref:glycine zipper 2TM domain-containing protein n=1 Tax=Phenylobacterium sp. TaxID=1871053 RepID=UPI002F925753
MKAALKIGMASALALASVTPAAAQYYQPTPQYQQDLSRYQSDRNAYEARRDDYERARMDFERRRADWERARAAYDARWGYGAYVRQYGPAPVWSDAYVADNYYAPAPAYAAPSAGYYGYNTATTVPGPVRCNNNSTVTAGVIGALAGAVLGSNVAARNARTEGAVLGAAVGGAIGAGVGRANDRYKCDVNGPYFTRNETIAYREADGYGYDRNQYRRYSRMGCRLAPAPVDNYGQDYRYVRVCPDASGRYRITG